MYTNIFNNFLKMFKNYFRILFLGNLKILSLKNFQSIINYKKYYL